MGKSLFRRFRVIEQYKSLDFEDRVADYIDALEVGIPLFYDTTTEDESTSLTRLPGGRTIQEYYDGIKDKQLQFELTIKARRERRTEIVSALSRITDSLSDLEDLPSENNSYDFQKIDVGNEIYFSEAKTDGFIYFKAQFQPTLTIY